MNSGSYELQPGAESVVLSDLAITGIHARPDFSSRLGRRLAGLFCTTALMGAAPAMAAGSTVPLRLFSSTDIIGASVAIGFIAAGLISGVWSLRRSRQMETDNLDIRAALSDAQSRISRYEALIADKNRRIIVWDGPNGQAEYLGQLPPETGAPSSDREFLAFGRWLRPRSAGDIEKAIDRLRSQAESFDIVLETVRDEIIEAQGRVSGGRAFVRFVALNNLRAELAEIQIERDRLAVSIRSFQTLLDEVEMPSWQRNPDGHLTWVNEAFSGAVGAPNPAAVIQDGREFLETATLARIKAVATWETPFRDQAATVVAGNRTAFDIVDVRTPGGSAGIAVDVTKTEAIRDELQKTLKSHKETLDMLDTPVAIFDAQQRLQFYNHAFRHLWNLDIAFLESHPTHGDVLDRLRMADCLPEQLNFKSWRDNVLSVYRSLEPHNDMWHLPNGQTLRVFATAHPQGGATWVFENRTEQVDLETRYNTAVKVQGETIDHLAEGVAVFSPDGQITLSNPAFRSLWGISAEEAKPGTHINDIEAACANSYDKPDGWKNFARLVTSFEDGRGSDSGKLELNSGLVLDYAVIPLPDAQMMVTFVNVTDSVAAERALTDKNEALRKADELKNDFVQHVSYELRSPLTNIIGFADLLRTPGMDPLTERQAEYLDHISNSSSVLLTLVNDILDLATVDAGIMQLSLGTVSISDLIDEVSLQIAHLLQESNVTLQIVAEHDLGMIVADHQRLKQILLKLLSNAANFAPDGSVIGLNCWRDGHDFLFTVADSGPGIPKDMVERIFNRFESNAKGGRKTGAGLGLSIVESFVSLHGGTIDVQSNPDLGTQITCRIPSAEVMNAAISAAE